eukprot:COSAG01_NODE_2568_length_7442_cov_23.918970_5_plen_173_part_00
MTEAKGDIQDVTKQYPALEKLIQEVAAADQLEHNKRVGTEKYGGKQAWYCSTCQGVFLVPQRASHFGGSRGHGKYHESKMQRLREGWIEGKQRLTPIQVFQPAHKRDVLRMDKINATMHGRVLSSHVPVFALFHLFLTDKGRSAPSFDNRYTGSLEQKGTESYTDLEAVIIV